MIYISCAAYVHIKKFYLFNITLKICVMLLNLILEVALINGISSFSFFKFLYNFIL